jgi:hypothetical protein
MEDARTLGLTIANLAFAVVAVAALITVTFAVVYEVITRKRKRAHLYAEIDRDLPRLMR